MNKTIDFKGIPLIFFGGEGVFLNKRNQVVFHLEREEETHSQQKDGFNAFFFSYGIPLDKVIPSFFFFIELFYRAFSLS